MGKRLCVGLQVRLFAPDAGGAEGRLHRIPKVRQGRLGGHWHKGRIISLYIYAEFPGEKIRNRRTDEKKRNWIRKPWGATEQMKKINKNTLCSKGLRRDLTKFWQFDKILKLESSKHCQKFNNLKVNFEAEGVNTWKNSYNQKDWASPIFLSG